MVSDHLQMMVAIPPRLRIFFLTLLVFCWSLLSAAELGATPNRRALLIGIEDYKRVSDLGGAVNDVMLMRALLMSKFGVREENICVLKNRQATRAGIIEAIRSHLIEKTKSGDVVILHYSGHGSQMRDRSKDEVDGFDETIVPHDSPTPGVFDISDDELNGLLAELTRKTKYVADISNRLRKALER